MTDDNARRTRVRDLLHAYELGLLTDDERRELELYVLETGEFLEDLREFGQAVRLLRGDPAVRAAVSEAAETKAADNTVPSRRSWWRSVVPGAVAVAAVVALLVLTDWEVVIKPRQQAIASEHRLAVMTVENLADAEDSLQLGKIATNLLITDLSQSRYIQVVSSQRLQDILRQLGHEGALIVGPAMATEVAQEAGARWMLTGSIVQREPRMVFALQIVEVATGDVVVSDRVVSEPGADIFALVDQITVTVKDNLGLPDAASGEEDRLVADVTSHSAEAYRHYLLGLDLYYKYYFPEAIMEFHEVLEHDSTFAMAYYYLGSMEDVRYIKLGAEYIDKASERDQYLIRSRDITDKKEWRQTVEVLKEALERYPDDKQFLLVLGQHYHQFGQHRDAIAVLRRAIEIDPFYKSAHNSLAYAYSEGGLLDSAIAAINRYIAVAPGEANPYDSRGDIYNWNGMKDEALESYRQAVDVKPDYYPSWTKMGDILICRGDFDQADSCYHHLLAANNVTTRSEGRFLMALVPHVQGRFAEARSLLQYGLVTDSLDQAATGRKVDLGSKYLLLSRSSEALGKPDQALAEMKLGFERSSMMSNYLHLYIQLLAQNGDFASAESELQYLRVADTATRPALRQKLDYAEGAVAYAHGQFDKALVGFQTADSLMPEVVTRYMLGRTFMQLKEYARAAELLQTIDDDALACSPVYSPWAVQAHYYCGLAYEEMAKYDEAASAYERFLTTWEQADPEIPSVTDARLRLERLRSRL